MAGPAQEACRPATPADVPRLAELASAAVDELRAGRGGDVWARTQGRQPPFESALADEVDAPDALVLAGTLDGTVVGYAVVRLQPLADGTTLGVLTDLYSEPGAREVGLGEVMMAAVVEWCEEQGCFGLDSLALPGDRHTKNFFESFGLVARAILVHRSLP